jgi:hypothetical protein
LRPKQLMAVWSLPLQDGSEGILLHLSHSMTLVRLLDPKTPQLLDAPIGEGIAMQDLGETYLDIPASPAPSPTSRAASNALAPRSPSNPKRRPRPVIFMAVVSFVDPTASGPARMSTTVPPSVDQSERGPRYVFRLRRAGMSTTAVVPREHRRLLPGREWLSDLRYRHLYIFAILALI